MADNVNTRAESPVNDISIASVLESVNVSPKVSKKRVPREILSSARMAMTNSSRIMYRESENSMYELIGRIYPDENLGMLVDEGVKRMIIRCGREVIYQYPPMAGAAQNYSHNTNNAALRGARLGDRTSIENRSFTLRAPGNAREILVTLIRTEDDFVSTSSLAHEHYGHDSTMSLNAKIANNVSKLQGIIKNTIDTNKILVRKPRASRLLEDANMNPGPAHAEPETHKRSASEMTDYDNSSTNTPTEPQFKKPNQEPQLQPQPSNESGSNDPDVVIVSDVKGTARNVHRMQPRKMIHPTASISKMDPHFKNANLIKTLEPEEIMKSNLPVGNMSKAIKTVRAAEKLKKKERREKEKERKRLGLPSRNKSSNPNKSHRTQTQPGSGPSGDATNRHAEDSVAGAGYMTSDSERSYNTSTDSYSDSDSDTSSNSSRIDTKRNIIKNEIVASNSKLSGAPSSGNYIQRSASATPTKAGVGRGETDPKGKGKISVVSLAGSGSGSSSRKSTTIDSTPDRPTNLAEINNMGKRKIIEAINQKLSESLNIKPFTKKYAIFQFFINHHSQDVLPSAFVAKEMYRLGLIKDAAEQDPLQLEEEKDIFFCPVHYLEDGTVDFHSLEKKISDQMKDMKEDGILDMEIIGRNDKLYGLNPTYKRVLK